MQVWVKRDDMTSGASAGNKIRKLEYLLAEALELGVRTVITCGAAQSNHARATAICARELGLSSFLLLRTSDPSAPPASSGNLLLDRLVGARLSFITPEQYRDRARLMERARAELAAEGIDAYVIPEGGSSGLGALGYVQAARELFEQQRAGELPDQLDAIALACGSGGTAAGMALGLGLVPELAKRVVAMAVCDDRSYFEGIIERIVDDARRLRPELPAAGACDVYDSFKGPAYGVPSEEQLHFMLRVARETGLLLDPTYTGKALFGLSKLEPKPKRALFLHTGGLPGLLAEAGLMAGALGTATAPGDAPYRTR